MCIVASRVNTPPVAVVKPSTQEVNEPNDLVIDGSGMLVCYLDYVGFLGFLACIKQ